jgi:hypothetical protein
MRTSLVDCPEEWDYSSSRFFEQGKSVGIPIVLPG